MHRNLRSTCHGSPNCSFTHPPTPYRSHQSPPYSHLQIIAIPPPRPLPNAFLLACADTSPSLNTSVRPRPTLRNPTTSLYSHPPRTALHIPYTPTSPPLIPSPHPPIPIPIPSPTSTYPTTAIISKLPIQNPESNHHHPASRDSKASPTSTLYKPTSSVSTLAS